MATRWIVGGTALVGAALGALSIVSYRREIDAARARLDRDSKMAPTAMGPVEYAEAGKGQPLLVIHGAGGGFDQGLIIGRDFGAGYRVIAPSRFGYLKTPVPEDSSPAAQADAHAALLDSLRIDRAIVVGVSAGGPSAVEFALRHLERVAALILLVPRTYDPAQSIGPDDSVQSQIVLRLIESSADFLFWAMTRVARGSVVRFLGVRPELEAAAPEEERARVTEIIKSILPLSDRVRGIAVDSNIKLTPWPLESLRVPALIVSAEDDLFGTLPGARFTAAGIAGAELHVLESGGHLMIGQGTRLHRWISDFLSRKVVLGNPPPRQGSEVPQGQTESVLA